MRTIGKKTEREGGRGASCEEKKQNVSQGERSANEIHGRAAGKRRKSETGARKRSQTSNVARGDGAADGPATQQRQHRQKSEKAGGGNHTIRHRDDKEKQAEKGNDRVARGTQQPRKRPLQRVTAHTHSSRRGQ